eukprot:TRINITY_DN4966_c0_g1_i1.p1 TRINITY_DN4966_c0_g1~~TRINITY_DN4966_c0_g1_i1.p1  ORF type:complete len:136 (-),score=4.63 TRINITY_DN4966_c0_g1_i1:68-475(-)
MIHRDSDFTVSSAPLKHTIPCWGYVIQEKDRPGRLNIEELVKRVKVEQGPILGDIKSGKLKTLPLPDGTMLDTTQFIGPTQLGRKITILGDTCDSSQIAGEALGSDILVHESTLGEDMIACQSNEIYRSAGKRRE